MVALYNRLDSFYDYLRVRLEGGGIFLPYHQVRRRERSMDEGIFKLSHATSRDGFLQERGHQFGLWLLL